MGADGIARRLSRLEAPAPPPCEECGHAPGVPITVYEVAWSDEPGDGPELCPKCGQRLVFVVTWGDDDRGGNAA